VSLVSPKSPSTTATFPLSSTLATPAATPGPASSGKDFEEKEHTTKDKVLTPWTGCSLPSPSRWNQLDLE
jgi:hypothetical protein